MVITYDNSSIGGSGGGDPTATPELGSGELLATGLLPIGAVLLYRRRRADRGSGVNGEKTDGNEL